MKVVINTSTFGEFSKEPLEMLERAGLEYCLNPYQRTLKANEVIALAKDAGGMIAGVEPLNEDVLRGLPTGLKVISRCGVGMDNVDISTANELKIKVFNTPFGPTVAVAELTVAVILNLLRKVNVQDAQMKSGQWKKGMGSMLFGKKVGIVGFGRIGQKVADLLLPFQVELRFYDVHKIESKKFQDSRSLDELLAWADIVSFHMPYHSGNGSLINVEKIQLMKKGSWIVNLSRGGIVDEEALYDALKRNHLAGAALDVFEEEPYHGKLLECENALLTPHVGSYAKEARIEMEKESVKNLINELKS